MGISSPLGGFGGCRGLCKHWGHTGAKDQQQEWQSWSPHEKKREQQSSLNDPVLMDSTSISPECSGRWPSLPFLKQQNVPVRISGCGVVAVQPDQWENPVWKLAGKPQRSIPARFPFYYDKTREQRLQAAPWKPHQKEGTKEEEIQEATAVAAAAKEGHFIFLTHWNLLEVDNLFLQWCRLPLARVYMNIAAHCSSARGTDASPTNRKPPAVANWLNSQWNNNNNNK